MGDPVAEGRPRAVVGDVVVDEREEADRHGADQAEGEHHHAAAAGAEEAERQHRAEQGRGDGAARVGERDDGHGDGDPGHGQAGDGPAPAPAAEPDEPGQRQCAGQAGGVPVARGCDEPTRAALGVEIEVEHLDREGPDAQGDRGERDRDDRPAADAAAATGGHERQAEDGQVGHGAPALLPGLVRHDRPGDRQCAQHGQRGEQAHGQRARPAPGGDHHDGDGQAAGDDEHHVHPGGRHLGGRLAEVTALGEQREQHEQRRAEDGQGQASQSGKRRFRAGGYQLRWVRRVRAAWAGLM